MNPEVFLSTSSCPQPGSTYSPSCGNLSFDEGNVMKMELNISKPMRIMYVAVGLTLIGIPFAATWEGWIRLLFPILGAVSVLEGLVGWGMACALLGRSKQE